MPVLRRHASRSRVRVQRQADRRVLPLHGRLRRPGLPASRRGLQQRARRRRARHAHREHGGGNAGVAAKVRRPARWASSPASRRARASSPQRSADRTRTAAASRATRSRRSSELILDGVDVINYSIGGGTGPYHDPVELAFRDAYARHLRRRVGGQRQSLPTPSSNPSVRGSPPSPRPRRRVRRCLLMRRPTARSLKLSGGSIGGDSTARRQSCSAADVATPADLRTSDTAFTGAIVVCERGDARCVMSWNDGAARCARHDPLATRTIRHSRGVLDGRLTSYRPCTSSSTTAPHCSPSCTHSGITDPVAPACRRGPATT